ncbi:MAG: peptidylprolyl isomerase [Zhengella sp.]|uniref:SurA N-terminal domain-containing protein n=1 Tax=Zhengella sp. TaxID=2282762 RepID=UPI001DE8514A|nr:peptidylprolyl isomerase [Notoacmeibacter sp.]MCC0028001.1 peptidylprolyl isomerase [Brucellaceae bacterium]
MTLRMKTFLTAGALATAMALSPLAGGGPAANQAQASEIRYVVNNLPVTSYDIARRAAFLRLQRRGGNINSQAADDMVEQALRSVEMQRLNVNIPKSAVDANFANFAKQNKLSPKQLSGVLTQSGVTTAHFKEFIRVQMGWQALLRARFRAEGRMSEQDVVQRMLNQGGDKPTATEYILQQVIFVVPAAERSAKLNTRKREAENMRTRFAGCDKTHDQAKGLLDVTVRDLGRVLEPELPPDWAPLIKAINEGQATKVRVTDRGAEFIAICRAKLVSDDRVAQMVFTNEGDLDEQAKKLSDKYMKELRERARIIKR